MKINQVLTSKPIWHDRLNGAVIMAHLISHQVWDGDRWVPMSGTITESYANIHPDRMVIVADHGVYGESQTVISKRDYQSVVVETIAI